MVGLMLGAGPTSTAAVRRAGSSPVPIVNRANTTVTAQGGGVYRIAKTGGADGAFDASAVSAVGLPGDFTLKMVLSTPNDSQLGWLGVNSDPLTDNDYISGDFGVLLSTGEWYIYESGGNPASFTDNATAVWIARRGTTLTYRQGATFAGAAISRTVPDVPGTLYFDSSIQDTTAVVDVTLTIP